MMKSLNILFSYPVKWSEYRVLRDLVQNFYDAKDFTTWWDYFSYTNNNGKLSMKMEDSVFSYEWLLHIGASTKQESNTAAGYFGEGFKIAALCAMRDFGWKITCASGDWCLQVVKETVTVDGNENEGMAYEVSERSFQNNSELVLEGITEKQYELFQTVLMSFFYPQNPLFGEKVFENQKVAVFRRSELQIPDQLPVTWKLGKNGAVFGRYQMVGTIPIPYVIAYHGFQQDDRDRKALYDHDILEILHDVAMELDTEAACELLSAIPDKWNHYPKEKVDLHTWYYVVSELIRSMLRSEKVCSEFCESHSELLYARRLLTNDIYAHNQRKMAEAWLRNQGKRYRIVTEPFRYLGVPELESVCKAQGGMVSSDIPNARERRYFSVLEKIATEIFEGFFVDTEDIGYRIIRNERAAYAGMANSRERSKPVLNRYGIASRRKLSIISMKERLLKPDCFDEAVSTYLHELSHMFGGDASKNFSKALTVVSQILLANTEKLHFYKEEWEDIEVI